MPTSSTRRPTSGHVFVDESKKRDYLLVAAVVIPSGLAHARQTMRILQKPGQRRLHMVKESPARQHTILSTIATLGAQVTIYQAGAGFRSHVERRGACLERLVEDIAAAGHTRLLLESEQGEEARDRRILYRQTDQHGCRDSLSYGHATAASEPLLAIPDAIAWAWARGGDARRRAEPLVTNHIRL
ncbi:hypothetical protein EXU48_23950 [Occultella glacieicola]|uniref:DUF3800 domain-containing protein n=1 Tax=Occultella glacieicola TaxID=2518684 RepID=A0ABY2DWV2_9MICO|nr:hypothetical protein [Occultella glacieicola]TDE88177.1 hypothetical protein EXU48_23950 [Occultella glacieicola]